MRIILLGECVEYREHGQRKRRNGYNRKKQGDATVVNFDRSAKIEVHASSAQSRNQIFRSSRLHRRFHRLRIGISGYKKYERTAIECNFVLDSDLQHYVQKLSRWRSLKGHPVGFIRFHPSTNMGHSRNRSPLFLLFPRSLSSSPSLGTTSFLFLFLFRVSLILPTISLLLLPFSNSLQPRSLTLSTPHGKSQIRVCLPGTWNPGGYRW